MKKVLVGLVFGLMLGLSTNVFAAVSDRVEAVFAKFSLIVNGATPMEIEPLTYKGSTYLPVRQTALLLGYDLTYEADNRTIIMKKPERTTATEEGGGGVVLDNEGRIQSVQLGDYNLIRVESIKTDSGEKINSLKYGEKTYVHITPYVGAHHRDLDTVWEDETRELTVEGVSILAEMDFSPGTKAFFYVGSLYVDLDLLESIPKRTPADTQQ